MQKLSRSDSSRAVSLLRRALPHSARIDRGPGTDVGDQLQVHVPGGPTFLLWLTASGNKQERRAGATPVLVLRTKHPKQRDRLRRRRQSYIDLAGAAYIEAPGFYLDRADLPPARGGSARGRGSDPYSDKASLVVRRLLSSPTSRRWSTSDLAEASGVDVSTASRVLRELRRRELVRDDRPGQGRKSAISVPKPEDLLADWAGAYSWEDNAQIRVGAPVGSPRAFISRMHEYFEGDRWALTLQAGASLMTPHAKFDVVHVYIDEAWPLEEFALARGWDVTPGGKLVLMLPYYSHSAWADLQTAGGATIVSTVQLVLDLWNYPVRGREQAAHLIETVLRPTWESHDESS